MAPRPEPLRMYGEQAATPDLDWSWAEEELVKAGTYWITPAGPGHPHPRPVWGVWARRQLHLSIGSPRIVRLVQQDAHVTVHLDSSNDVVILEGYALGTTDDSVLVEAYDDKYDWSYDVAQYGPLTTVDPTSVLAWRSAGWAGRDGFQQAGCWRFTDDDPRDPR